jgi:hypothetical protein
MEMYDYEYKKRPNRNDISKLLEVLWINFFIQRMEINMKYQNL